MARELTARQYDLFSLLFGDADTENATAQANDATDSISVNGSTAQSVNEKNLLDALREGLNYGNNVQNTSKSLNETFLTTASGTEFEPTTDGADIEDEEGEDGETEDDEEGISILDLFLNGAEKLDAIPTIPKQNMTVVQANPNVSKVVNEPVHIPAMTNGLMHIQPMIRNPLHNQLLHNPYNPSQLHRQPNITKSPIRIQPDVTKDSFSKKPSFMQSEVINSSKEKLVTPIQTHYAFTKEPLNIQPAPTKAPIIIQPAITKGPLRISSPITNSPMHIKPILPENTKNETVKFALLPMSLYNMVKDDGTIMFEETNTSDKTSTNKNTSVNNEWKTTVGVTITMHPTNEFTSSAAKTDSTIPASTVTESYATFATSDTTTADAIITTKSNPKNSYMSTKEIYDASFTTEQLPTEIRTETAINLVSNWKSISDQTSTINDFTTIKPTVATKRPSIKNNVQKQTSNNKQSEKIKESNEKIIISPVAHLPDEDYNYDREIVVKYSANFGNSSNKLTASTLIVNPLTTVKPSSSKPIIINSNPPPDINYDYSEPTLPPSLPNLKIIPFLPTDAVKNLVHTNRVKSNYNYYQNNASPYSDAADKKNEPVKYTTFSHPTTEYPKPLNNNNNYAMYNVKPTANDRIDYYSYGAEHKESLDYGLYSPFGGNVNTKLDYELYEQNHPSKLQTTSVKTVPYEADYDYDVYHLNNANEKNRPNFNTNYIPVQYSTNGALNTGIGEPFRAPDFEKYATIRPDSKHPLNDLELRSALHNADGKNKFTPPAKTEGK